MSTTIIVGGVAAGMSAATRLRRLDENMKIIVVENSNYVSFAGCGLPYHISGTIKDRSDLILQTPQSLHARFNLDVRVNTLVNSIDRETKTVTLTENNGNTSTENYDQLILCPGGTPIIPPIEGIQRAYTLRTIEDLDKITKHLEDKKTKTAAILGGGFIGLEVAENLTKKGIAVSIIEKAEQILGPLDPEMANIVNTHLKQKKIEILTGSQTSKITQKTIELSDGRSVKADIVIAAIGVKPRNELAIQAGLEVGKNGGIKVDKQLRTSDPNIYALGDAAEKIDAISKEPTLIPLAQTANRHGRLVADIITGRTDQYAQIRPTLGTAIVGLFGLGIGSVGWNEKRARQAGKEIRIVHLHPSNHAGYYPGAQTLHLKLIVDAITNKILGAQAIGFEGVDKRIDILSMAMQAGLQAQELADVELAYAPQYGSAKDPINMAGFIYDNMMRGEKTFQWHQVEQAIEQGWTLVDVRTEKEYANQAIPKAINIPLNELRKRADELKGKKVLAYCKVGQRAHVAVSMLNQLGIKSANLDGGYITYMHGHGEKHG